jgi:hypothetical protein
MRYWIKAFGSADKPLNDNWQAVNNGVLTTAATFAKQPMIEKGDRIVYYAATKKVIFAAGTVASHPYKEVSNSGGFTWRVDVSLEVKKEAVRFGASLEYLNLRPDNLVSNRIKRRSHVQLDANEYAAAVAALNA